MKMKKSKLPGIIMITMLTGCLLLTGCGSEPGNGRKSDNVQNETTEAAGGAAGEKGGGGTGGTAEETGGEAALRFPVESGQEEAGANDTLGIFTAWTLDGTEVSQEIFAENKLNMVNIWGTFCGPCIREMPDLGELNREYGEQGVKITGIISDVMEPGNVDAQDIVEATGADYMHLVLSEDLYYNYLYQVQSIPTTLFLDSSGNLVGSYVGAKEKADWEAIIDEMLAKAAEGTDGQ